MKKNELDRIKYVANNFLKMVDSLEDKTYDFSKIEFDDNVMKYILGDRWTLENKKIKVEKDRQFRLLDKCKNSLKQKYPDFYCIEYQTKVRDYVNYYLISIFGSPFTRADFIFDKNGKLLFDSSYNNGVIDCIDEDNFFFIKNDKTGNKDSSIHFKVCDNRLMIVKVLSDVHTNIRPSFGRDDLIKFENLVSWDNYIGYVGEGGHSILYNYKTEDIVVPEFTDARYDYGNFSLELGDDLIRIINSIKYNNCISKLEFLINEDGELVTDVFDFQRGVGYSRKNYDCDQEEMLYLIYEEARNNLMDEVEEKNGFKKVKKL